MEIYEKDIEELKDKIDKLKYKNSDLEQEIK